MRGFDQDMERFRGDRLRQERFLARWQREHVPELRSCGANFSYGDEIHYAGPLLGRQLNWDRERTLRPTSSLRHA